MQDQLKDKSKIKALIQPAISDFDVVLELYLHFRKMIECWIKCDGKKQNLSKHCHVDMRL